MSTVADKNSRHIMANNNNDYDNKQIEDFRVTPISCEKILIT